MTEVSKAIIHTLYHWKTVGDIYNMSQASVFRRFENCVASTGGMLYPNALPMPGQASKLHTAQNQLPSRWPKGPARLAEQIQELPWQGLQVINSDLKGITDTFLPSEAGWFAACALLPPQPQGHTHTQMSNLSGLIMFSSHAVKNNVCLAAWLQSRTT